MQQPLAHWFKNVHSLKSGRFDLSDFECKFMNVTVSMKQVQDVATQFIKKGKEHRTVDRENNVVSHFNSLQNVEMFGAGQFNHYYYYNWGGGVCKFLCQMLLK